MPGSLKSLKILGCKAVGLVLSALGLGSGVYVLKVDFYAVRVSSSYFKNRLLNSEHLSV